MKAGSVDPILPPRYVDGFGQLERIKFAVPER